MLAEKIENHLACAGQDLEPWYLVSVLLGLSAFAAFSLGRIFLGYTSACRSASGYDVCQSILMTSEDGKELQATNSQVQATEDSGFLRL